MQPCIIVDIDGTLSDASHRIHLLPSKQPMDTIPDTDGNWIKFLEAAHLDLPHPELVILSNKLSEAYPVVLCTGRRDSQRGMTIRWLRQHHIQWDHLLMRREGDRRPDTEVKRDMLKEIRGGLKLEPLFSVEDRASVVKMWREEGIRCLQVCEGDY